MQPKLQHNYSHANIKMAQPSPLKQSLMVNRNLSLQKVPSQSNMRNSSIINVNPSIQQIQKMANVHCNPSYHLNDMGMGEVQADHKVIPIYVDRPQNMKQSTTTFELKQSNYYPTFIFNQPDPNQNKHIP